jgi:hypothetical protein
MSDVQPAHGNGGTGERAALAPPTIADPSKKEIAPDREETPELKSHAAKMKQDEQFLAEYSKESESFPPEAKRLLKYIDLQDASIKLQLAKEKLVTQNEALAQQRQAQVDARRKERNKAEERNRFKPFLFIACTLGAWLLIMIMANAVVTCVPGGARCLDYEAFIPTTYDSLRATAERILPPSSNTVKAEDASAKPASSATDRATKSAGSQLDPVAKLTLTLAVLQWSLVGMVLLVALWIAKRAVYPNREFSDQ